MTKPKWKTVKIGEVCHVEKGTMAIQKAIAGNYPLVVTAENRKTSNEFQFDCKAVCIPLVSSTGHGHASLKRLHFQEGKFALGNILSAVFPIDENVIDPRFLFEYLSFYKDEKIVTQMKGSANVSLTIKNLKMIEIDMPSIEMQKEIVRQVQEVREAQLKIQQHLLENKLDLKALRQTILQLAVSGRLNTQNPSDEPARELLKRINAEKQALIKAGKLKAQKTLPPVDESKSPFEIPPSWVWTRLGEVGTWGAGSTPNRSNPSYYNGEITWFKSGELKTDVVYGSEEKITELALKECSLRLNQPNDVMIAMYGATIGKVSIAGAVCTTNQAVCACTPFSCITSHFLLLKLKALYPTFVNMGAGGAQPNISKEKIVNTPFPLPPLDEQKRIVAKVDELIALCDALEAQLNEQQSHATALLNSLVHELIGAGASA